MKRIVKLNPPPKSFTQWLRNATTQQAVKNLTINFNNGRTSAATDLWGHLQNPEKQDLWLQLCREQGFICAYCGKRLYGDGKVRIEHLTPKSTDIEVTFKYDNLVAVCDSTKDQKGTHCDVKRKDEPIFVSPINTDCESKFRFNPKGDIIGIDENIDKTIDVLGLQQRNLKADRENYYKTAENAIKVLQKNNQYKQTVKFEQQVNKLVDTLLLDF
jgi:uncharacterized protein (TIGR02646 family)